MSNNLSIKLTSPRPQITDFDRLPFPDRSLVDYEKYNQYIGQALVKNSISLQGTRGCPYQCAYCHKIWPKNHVFRSAENIFEELKLYYDVGVKRFAFIDDIFNLNQKNSSRFFELVMENGLDVKIFFPGGVRGDILTEDYVDLMVSAGTKQISVALETASPRLQKLLKKNLNLDKLKESIDYICLRHPQVVLDVQSMLGFPTETEAEAMMTLEFMKSPRWIHFPFVHLLKIYPNTDMEKLAMEHGISREDIEKSLHSSFQEYSTTLPFDESFIRMYQTDLLQNYFLLKERLLQVLPAQISIMTENEFVQKYNSYLPIRASSCSDVLRYLNLEEDELETRAFVGEEDFVVPDLNEKILARFPSSEPADDALRVLLLDLSQFFSVKNDEFFNLNEPPLGLMYLMTYLKERFGDNINGKIAKSRIDFDSFNELKALLDEFNPDLIGIRCMTIYDRFFHESVNMIREHGISVPIIAGGPYATSGYLGILEDDNVDLVVLGEGEMTLAELVDKFLENSGVMPDEEVLKEIPGIAFKQNGKAAERMSYQSVTASDIETDGLVSTFNDDLENE